MKNDVDSCTQQVDVEILVSDTCLGCPDVPLALVVPDVRCENEQITISTNLDDTEPYSFVWNDGSTGSTLSTTFSIGDHTVSVEITDVFGCTTSAETSFEVYSAPMISIEGNTSACAGDTVILSLVGDAADNNIIWSDGSTGTTTEVIAGDSYFVTVTANGCESTASLTISTISEPENTTLTCRDGIDNNCDGLVDCDDPECQLLLACDDECREQFVNFEVNDGGVSVDYESDFDLGSITEQSITLKARAITSSFEYKLVFGEVDLASTGLSISLDNNSVSTSIFNGQGDAPDFEFVCTNVPVDTEEGILYIRAVDGIVSTWTSEGVLSIRELDSLSGASLLLDFSNASNFSAVLRLSEDGCLDPINPDLPTCPPEVCGDGLDNDSDGLIDCDDSDCYSEPTFAAQNIGTCADEASGSITFSGSAELEFSIDDGSSYQSVPLFENLSAGQYQVIVRNTDNLCSSNIDIEVTQSDTTCTGCMDAQAHNFNENVESDDGSCQMCNDGILNGDEEDMDCGGLLCTPCIFGCTDNLAYNYDPTANVSDNSCLYCQPISINFNLPEHLCGDEESTINPTVVPAGNYDYTWHNGSTESTLSLVFASGAHTISLQVSDENGCPAEITETIVATAPSTLSISGNTEICIGDATALVVNENVDQGSIVWGTGDTTIEIIVDQAGTYSLSATVDGCPAIASITIEARSEEENTNQTCTDGIDNDCDGLIDCEDGDCSTSLLACDTLCRPQFVRFLADSSRLTVIESNHDIGSISFDGVTIGTRQVTSSFEYMLQLDGIEFKNSGLSLRLIEDGQSILLNDSFSEEGGTALSCNSIPENTEAGIVYIRAVNESLAVWTATEVLTTIDSINLAGASLQLRVGGVSGVTGTLSLMEDGCPEPIKTDLPECTPIEAICDDGVDNDGDGLVDCDDEECMDSTICDPEIYCEILSLITITQRDFNQLHFSFERDGSLDHTLSRLGELGLSTALTQQLINNLQTVRYDIEDSFLSGTYSYKDSVYLRLATMRQNFLSWKMNAFTKYPVLESTSFARKFILKSSGGEEEPSEEACEEIIKILIDGACENQESALSCHGIANVAGSGQTFLYFEPNISPHLLNKSRIYDLANGIEFVTSFKPSSTYERVSGQGPFLVITQDVFGCITSCIIEPEACSVDEDGQHIDFDTINVTHGACIRSDILIQGALSCGTLVEVLFNLDILKAECISYQSDEYGPIESDFEKICPNEDGQITITITDGFNIIVVDSIYINSHPPYNIDGCDSEDDQNCDDTENEKDNDTDGDGTDNEFDNDDDGDGIPDLIDTTPQGLDSDIDDDEIKNEEDCDIDGDNSPNHLDGDTDGDLIDNELDPDDDNDGILDIDDFSPQGIDITCPCEDITKSFPLTLESSVQGDSSCAGSDVTIRVGGNTFGAIFYHWDNGQSGAFLDSITITVDSTITIGVEVEFLHCMVNLDIAIEVANLNPPTFKFKTNHRTDTLWCHNWSDSTVLRLDSLMGGGSYTYNWSDGSSGDSLEVFPRDTVNNERTYTVTITDQYGCTAVESITFETIDCPCKGDPVLKPEIAATVNSSLDSNFIGGLFDCVRKNDKKKNCALDTLIIPRPSRRDTIVKIVNWKHGGFDIKDTICSNIYAMHAGWVQRVKKNCNCNSHYISNCNEDLGNQVAIISVINGDSLRFHYGHLKSIASHLKVVSSTKIDKNTYVKQGEIIGTVGVTGNACKSHTVPHVHVQVRNWINGGSSGMPLDPADYFATKFNNDATISTTLCNN